MRAPSTKVVKLYIIAIIFGIITHGNINRVDTGGRGWNIFAVLKAAC